MDAYMDLDHIHEHYSKYLTLTALFLVTYYFKQNAYKFWSIRKVVGPNPLPMFGNMASFILGRFTFTEYLRDLYNAYNYSPYIGFFKHSVPVLIIRDPELINHILVEDFDTFADRGIHYHESVEPCTANLYNIDGTRWGHLRTKFNPMFSSDKLKEMFNLIIECTQFLEKDLCKLIINKNNVIECQSLAVRYTVSVMSSCIFGIDVCTLPMKEKLLRNMAKMIFEPNFGVLLKKYIDSSMPMLFKHFSLQRMHVNADDFYVNIMGSILEERKKVKKRENMIRYDFVDLLLRAQREDTGFDWSHKNIATHVFAFYMAGVKSTTSTISFALYELAQAPEIQEKLQKEINDTIAECNGHLTYDTVFNMQYLRMVHQEVLRKYPAFPEILRRTTKSCTLGDISIDLPAGLEIIIPVYAIHYDPKYYPRPEAFDPERFSDDLNHTRPNAVYLPFGKGPRNCIGKRFGELQSKLALITILKNYRVSVCDKTDIPYKPKQTATTLSSDTAIELKFAKIIY